MKTVPKYTFQHEFTHHHNYFFIFKPNISDWKYNLYLKSPKKKIWFTLIMNNYWNHCFKLILQKIKLIFVLMMNKSLNIITSLKSLKWILTFFNKYSIIFHFYFSIHLFHLNIGGSQSNWIIILIEISFSYLQIHTIHSSIAALSLLFLSRMWTSHWEAFDICLNIPEASISIALKSPRFLNRFL